MKIKSIFENIHTDIIRFICLLLDSLSLAKLIRCSKHLKELILDKYFMRTYAQKYLTSSEEFPNYSVVYELNKLNNIKVTIYNQDKWNYINIVFNLNDYIAKYNYDIFVKKNLNKINKNELLIYFTKYGNLEMVEYLINDAKAEIDYVDERFLNALCYASIQGNLKILKLLISKNIDIHYDNEKALSLALINRKEEIIEYLINKGADINKAKIKAYKHAYAYYNGELIYYLNNIRRL